MSNKKATKGKKITDKQRAFAKEYVLGKDRLNATQATMNVYKAKNRKVAQSVGSENLSKPIVQHEIVRLMEEHGLNDEVVAKTFRRNLTQDKQLSVSQSAVKDYLQLKGYTNDTTKGNTKIAFVINT